MVIVLIFAATVFLYEKKIEEIAAPIYCEDIPENISDE